MNQPHDPNGTADVPAVPADSLGTVDYIRDSASTDGSRPGADAPANEFPTVAGYRVLREIARGGMGRVLSAHDLTLDREVALKILLPGADADRFVRESKISARLPHPGIPPVHALGTLADGSPFLAMKLIAGHTLAVEMKTADRPRLLQAFTQVCQAVGFAHSRGVIHRDLKPSNVMVGAFGEVQVMDWGLAKEVNVADRAGATTVGAAQFASPLAGETRAGAVMGTPAYMAPEQARGEATDARTDVFALGGVLCAILTGAPPFNGESAREAIRRAGAADLAEAWARLDGCKADAELVTLCRRCLSPSQADRPADGQAVADGLTAYLNGVQERLQAAERERAVAVARAKEERRRRKVQLALAASLLAFTTLAGLSTAYYFQQRQARIAAVERVVGQAETLLDQAKAQPEDLSRWQVALTAVEQLGAGDDAAVGDRLPALRTEIRAGLNAARRDQTLLDRVVDIRSAEADDPDGSATDAAYADAFGEAGIDFARLAPAAAAATIRARPPSVALALAGALDDWAGIRWARRADDAGSARLREAARAADPDPWRNQLRNALDQSDKAARLLGLQALAKSANFDELGPISLQFLGAGLYAAGDSTLAESVLRSAQQRYPRNVWVNYTLGRLLDESSRRDEAIRFYTAARAIQPETALALGRALENRGDSDEALAVFRDLKGLRPGDARILGSLGRALKTRGLSQEAGEMFDAAVTACREAIRLNPDAAVAHDNLGVTLFEQGKDEEAIAEYRTAIRLRPDLADFRFGLAAALANRGRHDEAVVEYRTGIRLKPNDSRGHNDLGGALINEGKLDEAVAEYRTAIRLKPDYAEAHCNLGDALGGQGNFDEAIAEYRTAIRLKPNLVEAHYDLGNDLSGQGKLDEAVVEYRTAIRLKPDFAEAHCNLGLILKRQGDYAGAVEMLRKGHELGARRPDWRYPSAQWVAQAERELALAKRLPAVLRGEDQPADNAERVFFARLAFDSKEFAATARSWTEAFAADPALANDLRAGHRYNAACAAALAAAGQGKEEPPLDDAAKAKLRRQALDWLKADLTAWGQLLESGPPQARPFIVQTLNHWKQDNDLASIRDALALTKLPAEERPAFIQLWAEVDGLLKDVVEKPK